MQVIPKIISKGDLRIMQYDNKELFYDYFKSSIISDSKLEDNEKPMEEAFTERMLEELIEIDHLVIFFHVDIKVEVLKQMLLL